MKYAGELESLVYPGFFYVPSLPQTLINAKGQVVDLQKQWCPLPDTNPDGYVCVNSENNRRFIHRLLALTFLEEPDIPVTELDVNHIDGVKNNNSVDNLEWATRSANCLHAYRTGLRTDNTPILVKDLRDGTVVRHYSQEECARAFGVDGSLVYNELKARNVGKVFKKHYILIREGSQWPATGQEAIGQFRNGTAKAMVAKKADSSFSIIFESAGLAAEHFGYKRATLRMHVRRYGSKSYRGWCFEYLDDDYGKQGKESNHCEEKSYLPEMVS